MALFPTSIMSDLPTKERTGFKIFDIKLVSNIVLINLNI